MIQPEIKKLLKEVKGHKALFTVVGVAGLIYSISYSRLALVIKDLTDNLSSGSSDKMINAIIIAFSLAVISNISKYFHIYCMNVLVNYVMQGLREKLQMKFMRLSLAFHSSYITGSGGLISRIVNDIRVIQDGLRIVADFFTSPLLLILLVGNLIYLDWKLTLIVFTVFPFLAIVLRNITRSLRKYLTLGQENLEKMTSTIKETLDGIRVIQSFNLEKFLSQKYQNQGKEYIHVIKKMLARMETGPAVELVATAVMLTVMYYIAIEISKGNATTGSFMAYITSLLMINQPMKRFQEAYYRIQEVVVSSRRIFEILEADGETPVDGKNLPFPQYWKQIEYRNVSFSYGNEIVLKNLNLTINNGEFVAFVGSSGSGKSTVLNLLERFYDPIEGEILIDGINIRDINLSELRANISLVSQDVFLFSDTIEMNIIAGNLHRDPSVLPEIIQSANASDFISRLKDGVKSQAGERGGLLSGGEKQRISIARAMFKDAPILLLDEATSALDSASEKEVQKGLDKLMKGKTSLVVAHRLSTIQNADKIFVMRSGTLVETGKHSELIQKNGEYTRFYKLQDMNA